MTSVVTVEEVESTFFPTVSTASPTFAVHQSKRDEYLFNLLIKLMEEYAPNPSREARTISPGRRLKNFFPGLEFTTELVTNPATFNAPDKTPVATFSDIFVTFFTLLQTKIHQKSERESQIENTQGC